MLKNFLTSLYLCFILIITFSGKGWTETQEETVNLNFDNADISSIIETIFGEILKVNYTIEPEVQGKINFRSTVPIEKKEILPLMEKILKLNGVNIIQESEKYKIYNFKKTKAKPEIYTYPIQNNKAKDIANILQPLLPALSEPESTTGTKIFPDEVTNSLVISSTPENYKLITEIIKKIDIVPKQVMIEGLIARVDTRSIINLGIQWTLKNSIKLNSPIKAASFTSANATENITIMLQSLETEGKAKILAAPHIMVENNKEARIQVGSQIPIASQTTRTPVSSDNTTTTNTSTVQYKDIGIILRVKPQVNENNFVSLEISQEISSIGESVKIADQEFQSITKTEAVTNVIARDGETVVIGGLIRENTIKSKTGIPILSKIPILGFLFGNTVDETTKNELIILLTPKILKPSESESE